MRQVKEYIYVQNADKTDTFIKRFNPILERVLEYFSGMGEI